MQGLVNVEKPCVPSFNKTKHNQDYKHMNYVSTRGSLMTQFSNFDIEKTLQYIITSNKMLVILKWSRKYTTK